MIDDEHKPRTGEWLIAREGSAALQRVRIEKAWANAVLVRHHSNVGYCSSTEEYLDRARISFVQRVDT